jgi:hypothetical protein
LGPRNLPDQLMGCSGLCALDRISLSISTERAQGHFLSPWSKSGAPYTKEPRYSLCVCQYGSRKPTAGVSKKSLTFLDRPQIARCSTLRGRPAETGGSPGKPEARSTRGRFRLSSRLREVSRRAYEARLLVLFAYRQIKALAILKCRGVDLFSLFEKQGAQGP